MDRDICIGLWIFEKISNQFYLPIIDPKMYEFMRDSLLFLFLFRYIFFKFIECLIGFIRYIDEKIRHIPTILFAQEVCITVLFF